MEKSFKKNRIADMLIIAIIAILFAAIIFFNFSKNQKEKSQSIKSVEDAAKSTIAVLTGSSAEQLARNLFKEAEIKTYNLNSDAMYAVEIGNEKYGMALKFAVDDYNKKRDNALMLVGDSLRDAETGIFFARSEKNKKILPQFNEFLADIKANDEFKKIDDRWFGDEEDIITFDFESLDDTNGTIVFAIDATYPPYAYVYNNSFVGFDVELVYRFCEKYRYGLDVRAVDFSGMLPGIKSGMFDIGGGGNTITEERKKSVDFSDPIKANQMFLYTKNDNKKESFSDLIFKIKESIYITFVEENRYELFLKGLRTTIFMSFASIILGTILSFAICVLRLVSGSIVNKICDIYVSVLQGVPIVVLLLLFYYIIFKSNAIPAEYIAIVAFTLNFSAYVSEILMSAIRSIDVGQWEASYALGFGYIHTFLRFVFPQSLVSSIPVYKGEIISLIKSTAIVGYIAVQDLTKMSDIIRSRTFEPFVPIITVALMYYIFAFVITYILNRFVLKVDWKKR
ncbi:MAG: ABC transporter permease subunit [Lachnospiraceae bacterium]|nr:ABC transporter permease subunit [Lachnospiraceae bacterium]